MPPEHSSPHDALFKRVFSQPEHAASELRSILPPALLEQLDLDQLTLLPGSYIDPALRSRHTDLLFLTRSHGRDALIYVLMEHQSNPERFMAMRMLDYILRIWERYLRDNKKVTRLPVVIPVVLYPGRAAWRYPCQLADLLDIDPNLAADPAIAPLLPRFSFLLDDVSKLDDNALRARPLTAPTQLTLLLLARAAGRADLVDDLQRWIVELRAVFTRHDGAETLASFITYINTVAEGSAERLRPILEQVGPEAEEVYMTIAEQLRAEGVAKGKAEVLLKFLGRRFGVVPDVAADMIRFASVEQLDRWTDRVLDAPTMDDVLR